MKLHINVDAAGSSSETKSKSQSSSPLLGQIKNVAAQAPTSGSPAKAHFSSLPIFSFVLMVALFELSFVWFLSLTMPQIEYSEKYYDDTYEYRHVELPPEVARLLPKDRLLSENEWRGIGVQQSRGWVHYAIHRPEPHIMLFRRPLNYQQNHQQQAQQHPAQAMGLPA